MVQNQQSDSLGDNESSRKRVNSDASMKRSGNYEIESLRGLRDGDANNSEPDGSHSESHNSQASELTETPRVKKKQSSLKRREGMNQDLQERLELFRTKQSPLANHFRRQFTKKEGIIKRISQDGFLKNFLARQISTQGDPIQHPNQMKASVGEGGGLRASL